MKTVKKNSNEFRSQGINEPGYNNNSQKNTDNIINTTVVLDDVYIPKT